MVLSIYTRDGDFIASWPFYDIDSFMNTLNASKIGEVLKNYKLSLHEQTNPEPTAAGLSPASGSAATGTAAGPYQLTAGANPDESVNGNGEYTVPGIEQ